MVFGLNSSTIKGGEREEKTEMVANTGTFLSTVSAVTEGDSARGKGLEGKNWGVKVLFFSPCTKSSSCLPPKAVPNDTIAWAQTGTTSTTTTIIRPKQHTDN